MSFLDKVLMLIIAFSMILTLVFLSMVIIDLNELWSAINETMAIIKAQEDKIRSLHMLFISKPGIGV